MKKGKKNEDFLLPHQHIPKRGGKYIKYSLLHTNIYVSICSIMFTYIYICTHI